MKNINNLEKINIQELFSENEIENIKNGINFSFENNINVENIQNNPKVILDFGKNTVELDFGDIKLNTKKIVIIDPKRKLEKFEIKEIPILIDKKILKEDSEKKEEITIQVVDHLEYFAIFSLDKSKILNLEIYAQENDTQIEFLFI